MATYPYCQSVLIVIGFSFIISSCHQDEGCDYLTEGKVEKGVFIQEELGWSMSLPESYLLLDSSEYVRIANVGNEAAFGNSMEKTCTQNLARWITVKDNDSVKVFINCDPVTSHPEGFEFSQETHNIFTRLASERNFDYWDSTFSVELSGFRWKGMMSEFVMNGVFYQKMYETLYRDRYIVISISGRNLQMIEDWSQRFEQSKFGKRDSTLAYQTTK
ncbi:MAG: hypothetical protein KDD67_16780 [Ignavibacteriae bacterium]|nr:hypothetical protein [Ignavibacteriota bacterium]MCB9217387.1 hypothetical protein [Ignavibacteria bacterium]